jgi:hypothetical protein
MGALGGTFMKNYPSLSAIILYFLLGAAFLPAAPATKPLESPVVFEPNLGQAPAQFSWIAHGPGYRLLLTAQGADILLQEGHRALAEQGPFRTEPSGINSPDPSISTLRMKLNGSHSWNNISGLEPTGGFSNYLVGRDTSLWRTHIPQYAKLRISSVYDGIDLVFYSRGSSLEYDFVVAPGANARQIRLAFEGAQQIAVDHNSGDLVVTTAKGSELRHARPAVYQMVGNRRIDVTGGYQIVDRTEAAFTLTAYDQHHTLVIDPTVLFTTFLAGSNSDVGAGIAVDSAGNSYVTGYTLSTNFPVSPFQFAHGGSDAFVTKLSPTGAIMFSTYLGGVGVDLGSGIAVDSEGVYITGYTDSKDFPSRDHRGPKGGDAFVTKLNPNTGGMIYTYFLGGTNIESGYAIAVDSSHAPYVAGITYSSDFPAIGALQLNFGGYRDGFVAKLNPAGYYLDWATYIGGSGFDAANAIAVDNAGFTYVTGVTASADFPVTEASQSYPTGASSTAFVTKLKPGGLGTAYSVLWGGGGDSGLAITADANGNAYVAGATTSPNLLTSSGAFQKTKISPNTSVSSFVTRMTDPGIWVFSTYVSGSNGDTYANAIALDRYGDVYVAGDTSSTTLPGAPLIVPNPTAGFLMKLNSTLSTNNYTIFLGAQINGLVVTQPFTRLPIFTYPTIYTSGYRYTDGTNASNTDAFVVKLDERPVIYPFPF